MASLYVVFCVFLDEEMVVLGKLLVVGLDFCVMSGILCAFWLREASVIGPINSNSAASRGDFGKSASLFWIETRQLRNFCRFASSLWRSIS